MYYISEKEFEPYANIILHLVAVSKGDFVLINCELHHAPLVHALVRGAYEKGARYVHIQLKDIKTSIYRALYSSPEENLSFFSKGTVSLIKECCNEKACVISIRSTIDPDLSKDVSSRNLTLMQKTEREHLCFFKSAISKDEFSWIVVSFPSAGWAKNIFPHLPEKEGVRKLWDIIKPILKLDHNDPIAAWKQHQAKILKRREYLNQKNFIALHITSDTSDMTIALSQKSTWLGALHTSENGKLFQANLPTEEVYTSPDCRYTQGTVTVQRPITIFEKKIEGIQLSFSNGAVVDFKADKNEDMLECFLNADPRNRYLGEIALVDTHSPIWKSGLFFNDILYDENAGVHFALGFAYATGYGFKSTDTIPSPESLIEMGCNTCNYHTDFTIGYEGLNVFGVTKDNKEEPLIQNGLFCIL